MKLKTLALGLALAASSTVATLAQAADTIKVGVLHSLSGTMAISETVLKDTVLMAIEEINAKGGLLGKKLEPVVVEGKFNVLPNDPYGLFYRVTEAQQTE